MRNIERFVHHIERNFHVNMSHRTVDVSSDFEPPEEPDTATAADVEHEVCYIIIIFVLLFLS